LRFNSDDHPALRKITMTQVQIGPDGISLGDVGCNQCHWIDVFGAQMLPKLAR